jgi:hypothetical protein
VDSQLGQLLEPALVFRGGSYDAECIDDLVGDKSGIITTNLGMVVVIIS